MSYRIEERPGIHVFRNDGDTVTIAQISAVRVGEDLVVVHPDDIDSVVAALLKVRDEIVADGAVPGMIPTPDEEP